jgi:hypothetical protein
LAVSKFGSLVDRATKKDPREVLLEAVHEAASMSAAMKSLLDDMDVETLQNPEAEGHARAKQTHDYYRVWSERAMKASKMALDVGIDESMVKLAELQAKQMVTLVRRVIGADVLQLDQRQQKLLLQLLGQGMRELAPDVSTTQTEWLHTAEGDLPYNPAMDARVVPTLDAVRRHNEIEYRSARKARLREEARLGQTSSGAPPAPALEDDDTSEPTTSDTPLPLSGEVIVLP